MKIIEEYLKKIQKEYGYANPLQTRPKPTGGIIKKKKKKKIIYPLGVKGPAGAEVDLDQAQNQGQDI